MQIALNKTQSLVNIEKIHRSTPLAAVVVSCSSSCANKMVTMLSIEHFIFFLELGNMYVIHDITSLTTPI